MRQGWRGVLALILIVAAAGVGAGAGAKVARNGLTTATLIGLGVALLLVVAATVLGRRAP